MENKNTDLEPKEQKDRSEVSSMDKSQDKDTESVEPKEPVVTEEPNALPRKLEEVESKLENMRSQYLRAVADLDNFRKRSVREKQELMQYACAPLIEGLLPTFDSFKMGLKAAKEAAEKDIDIQPVTKGFNLVFEQLFGILSKNGLKEINPEGETFDPNLHKCLTYQPSDVIPADTVISVTRVGYLFHKRLLRSAEVLVSSGPEKVDEGLQNTWFL